jgi:hypothetical protein
MTLASAVKVYLRFASRHPSVPTPRATIQTFLLQAKAAVLPELQLLDFRSAGN